MRIELPLNRTGSAKYLNDQILYGQRQGESAFEIIPKESVTYSNVCAPVAGVIDFYRNKGYSVSFDDENCNYVKHLQIGNPFIVKEASDWELRNPLDKVWTLTEESEAWKIVDCLLLAARENTELEDGVAQALGWCMSESIDNVLQHSKAGKCFIMAQIHQSNQKFNFCVFDTGIGIYNSFKGTDYETRYRIDALKYAMSESITSNKAIGQGNGLWGLSQIIKETNGRITLCSSGAQYSFLEGEEDWIENGCFNLGKENGTTMVDFQLDYSQPIDVLKALNGYEPYDKWADDHENDLGHFSIKIAKESNGTGTRKSAEKVRNIIIGAQNSHYSKILIDFSDVKMISSSFADELIGKLIAKYGFSAFMQHIVILNTNKFIDAIINRSVGQRMAQLFMDYEIDETDSPQGDIETIVEEE